MGCGCGKGRKVNGIKIDKKGSSNLTEKQKRILERKRKLVSIQASKHPKVKR